MIQLQQQAPQRPARSKTRRITTSPIVFVARLVLFPPFVVVAGVFALPSLVAGLFLWWWSRRSFDPHEFRRVLVTVAICGAVIYGTWLATSDPLPSLLGSLLFALTHHLWRFAEQSAGLLWLFNLLLTPLTAPVLAALAPSPLMRNPKAAAPKQPGILEYEQDEAQAKRQLAQFERMVADMQEPQQESSAQAHPSAAAALSTTAPNRAVLGVYRGGELAEMASNGLFCLAPELLELHGTVAGEPKTGKTTSLLRLAAIARAYGRRVFYLDLKGSKRTAALFLAAMSALGVQRARVYPVQAYNGWIGDTQALYNRLMQQIDPSSHPFYRKGVGSTVVSLAVKAPSGPPRSSYEFLERLDLKWLEDAYANDAQALREIKAVTEHIGGVALVFAGFFRGINGGLDGRWSYDDCEACYIGVNGVAHREEAAALGRYLIDDAAHYATARKAPDEQVLLIIDEFGVLDSTNSTTLYEQIREAGMSVYSAGQSYESLGRERDHLLAASAVKILHRSGNPEPFIKYAGERDVYKFSRHVGGEAQEETLDLYKPMANKPDSALGIMRPDKEYAIPIERVQQLAVGHIALISQGHGAYIEVQQLAIPDPLVRAANRFIAHSGHYQPLPPPQPPADPNVPNSTNPANHANPQQSNLGQQQPGGKTAASTPPGAGTSPKKSPKSGAGPVQKRNQRPNLAPPPVSATKTRPNRAGQPAGRAGAGRQPQKPPPAQPGQSKQQDDEADYWK